MYKSRKIITGSLCCIFLLAVLVFLFLDFYMSRQTESDIRRIASVHLNGITSEELHRYEVFQGMYLQLMGTLVNAINSVNVLDRGAIKRKIAEFASSQNLKGCALVAEDGTIDSLYGCPIKSLNDPAFMIKNLSDMKEVISAGWDEEGAVVLVGLPFFLNMNGGDELYSVGLLCSRPLSSFAEMMNLRDNHSLVHFHLIRHDGSYVVWNNDVTGLDIFDKIAYGTPLGMTSEEATEKLKNALTSGSDFKVHMDYHDDLTEKDERRTIYATPLPLSNWYLVSIIPYGELDVMIMDMEQARFRGTIISVSIIALCILTLLFYYMSASNHQIRFLDLARRTAEENLKRANAATEQANKAQAEAEAANKAKSEFLSNMSHDIRTPMNAILGMTAIAQEHLNDRERVADCLQKISLSGKHLLGLINDVLDMSKIESGKMTLTCEAISLRRILETVCDIVRPQIKAKNQRFDILTSSILTEDVYCDSVRLNQVLINFLSNAIKFTPEGGAITIGLRQEPSPKGDAYVRTYLWVKDTGIGMTDAFKAKLFSAFEREDNLRVHKTQGSGLGMSIVKFIVDAMDGTIQVDSVKDMGTTFLVTVDLERVQVTEAKMHLPSWKLLVVDDSEDLCLTTKDALISLGAQVDTCLSGKVALELVQNALNNQSPYFAVLLDRYMDEMDGLETARRIHAIAPATKLILITSGDWSDIETEAKSFGLCHFVLKPLFKSTLYHELIRYDASHAQEQHEHASALQRIDLHGIRILLAEDNELNAEIAIEILTSEGAEVEHAEDGAIALQMFEASAAGYYALILMDLRMPNMNGLEATRSIRALKRQDATTIPIVAMTADAFADNARECLEAGMNAHLAKPINVEDLHRTLAKYLKGLKAA